MYPPGEPAVASYGERLMPATEPHPCHNRCRYCKVCICDWPNQDACFRCLKGEAVADAEQQRATWEAQFGDPSTQFVATRTRVHRRDCPNGPGMRPDGDIVLDPSVGWAQLVRGGLDGHTQLFPKLLTRLEAEALKIKRCEVCWPDVRGPVRPTGTLTCDVCGLGFVRGQSSVTRLTCSPVCSSLRRVRQGLRKELERLRDGTPTTQRRTQKPGDPETLAAVGRTIEDCLSVCAAAAIEARRAVG